MLVGLSPNTGPPIKCKFVAISSNCLNVSTFIWIDKCCQLRRPISLTIRGLSPSQSTAKSLSPNDASGKSPSEKGMTPIVSVQATNPVSELRLRVDQARAREEQDLDPPPPPS